MRIAAILVAAGSGSRFGAETPKQFLAVAGKPVIRHAAEALARDVHLLQPVGDAAAIAAALGDLPCLPTVPGGATRQDSVRAGLEALVPHAPDVVLVHDAARPCLTVAQVDALIREVGDDAVGGLLANPVADTLKRADSSLRVTATVSRDQLWQAQTPQMFRHRQLLEALQVCADVTDESGAIEALGLQPRLVHAEGSNLKVTWPEDLRLAELILGNREA